MKICIYGAGAIGGYMGAELARSGADVSLIARGPHLAEMRKNGLKLRIGDEEHVTHPACTDNPADLGPQDFIIVTLKAHSVPQVVVAMQPLLGPDTALVTAVNGVPWWYFHNLGGDYEGRRVEAVDPGNVQWDGIGPERAIGCVVYPACEIIKPGVVQHISGNKFTLGEPSGEKTHRIESLSQALMTANMKAPIRPRIRDEIWIKLWGNLSFNPISALTSATLEEIAGDEGTRSVVNAMMVEAQAVGEAIGVNFPISVEKRINGAGAVGAHKTSMLQDLELGRPMEIDALVAAVSEMGTLVGINTPTINTILALVRQRARIAGCYF
jgi:2-dehydropantoate 2-reductase